VVFKGLKFDLLKFKIMEYKVIPFVASINHTKGTSNHVAEQLEEIILIKAGSMFD
jgi:hypothetical protein